MSKKNEILLLKYVDMKVKLNARDNDGSTVLHAACIQSDSKIAEILMDKCDDLELKPYSKDNYGFTAFNWVGKAEQKTFTLLCLISEQALIGEQGSK